MSSRILLLCLPFVLSCGGGKDYGPSLLDIRASDDLGGPRDLGPDRPAPRSDQRPVVVDSRVPDARVPDSRVPDTAPPPDLSPPPPDQKLFDTVPTPDLSLCGNGVRNPGEDCDGSKLNATTCKNLNFHKGTLKCSKTCTFDTSGCSYFLETTPISLTGYTGLTVHPRPVISSNGSNWLIVSFQKDSANPKNNKVTGLRVAASGKVLDKAPYAIAAAPYIKDTPGVAFNGSKYLVVWSDKQGSSEDVRGVFLSSGGAVSGKPFVINARGGTQTQPSVTAVNMDFYVVWTHSDSFYEVRGTTVTQAGKVMDTTGKSLYSYSSILRPLINPTILYHGTGYALGLQVDVTFNDDDVYVHLFDTKLNSLKKSVRVCRLTAFFFMELTTYGYVLSCDLYSSYPSPGRSAVSLKFLERSFKSMVDLTPATVSHGANGSSEYIAFGSSGSKVFATWMDDTYVGGVWSSGRIQGSRFTAAGKVLNTPRMNFIGFGPMTAIGYNGTHFLCIWRATGGWYGARLLP